MLTQNHLTQNPHPMPFLALSRELRNHVYEYVTNLNTHPFKSYSGFYLSCRQIKEEVDYQGTKVLERRIAQLKRSFAGQNNLKLNPSEQQPVTFKDMRSICLSLNSTIYTLNGPNSMSHPTIHDLPYVQSLFEMHLDSLVVMHHDNDGSLGACGNAFQMNWLRSRVLGPEKDSVCHIRAGRLILNLLLAVYEGFWEQSIYRDMACWTLEKSVFKAQKRPKGSEAYATFRSKGLS